MGSVSFTGSKLGKYRIMARSLESVVPLEDIEFRDEMPSWKQLQGGRNKLFIRPLVEKDEELIRSTVHKLFHRWDVEYTPEEKAHNEKIIKGLDSKGYDTNAGCTTLSTLQPDEALSEEVVNWFGRLYSERELLDYGKRSRFLIFNTSIYGLAHKTLFTDEEPAITDWPTFYAKASVVNNDSDSGSFENRPYLIFPACNNSHFLLVIFAIRKWQLLILDSLDSMEPPDIEFRKQAAYVVITPVKSMLYLRQPEFLQATKVQCFAPMSNIPKQSDSSSCGVFCILYMDAFTKGIKLSDLKWSEKFINETRMRLAADMLKGGGCSSADQGYCIYCTT